MSRSDQLQSLFDPQAQDVGVRQGTIITWNPLNGQNSVQIPGALLQNVSILNTGEAIALRAGHNVVLLRIRTNYFILGRVTAPNDPEFASASLSFAGIWGSANGFEIPSSGLQITLDVTVPTWADEALVLVVSNMSAVNTVGNPSDYMVLETLLDDTPGRPAYPQILLNALGTAATSAQRVIDVGGRTSFAVGCRWRAQNNNWTAHGSNIASFDAIAIFRSAN